MSSQYKVLILLFVLAFQGCQNEASDASFPDFPIWTPYDEAAIIDSSQTQDDPLLRYKRIQSPVLDKNDLIASIKPQLNRFTHQDYLELAPLIYEKSIPELQQSIKDQKLSYTLLTQWYLYRIASLEPTKQKGLNAIIQINPKVVEQAKVLDKNSKSIQNTSIYGMPILLKDNINTTNLRTTAGAMVLKDHQPKENAIIVQNLIANKALILGKVNLSEWANFLCDGCPNGYSAIGGQTLNPYGPRRIDTGGSSAGSGASIAANYAVAAVGTETSGSILSPSSQHSLVGLKPTVKQLSQQGIIPISSTLDTPGPMTKFVIDNAILYQALKSPNATTEIKAELDQLSTNNLKLGVIKRYLNDSLVQQSITRLEEAGVNVEIIEPEPMNFSGFLELLNGDMKRDLKSYLETYASSELPLNSVEAIVQFNQTDSLLNIPYGQARLDGIVDEDLSDEELQTVRTKLHEAGQAYFENMFNAHQIDALVSMNNYNAGQAAVAKYPAITVPMGLSHDGEPKGLTFIAPPQQEQYLLQIAYLYEQLTHYREPASNYEIKSD